MLQKFHCNDQPVSVVNDHMARQLRARLQISDFCDYYPKLFNTVCFLSYIPSAIDSLPLKFCLKERKPNDSDFAVKRIIPPDSIYGLCV